MTLHLTLKFYLKLDPICDRLWENGAFGAENKNVVFNLF